MIIYLGRQLLGASSGLPFLALHRAGFAIAGCCQPGKGVASSCENTPPNFSHLAPEGALIVSVVLSLNFAVKIYLARA